MDTKPAAAPAPSEHSEQCALIQRCQVMEHKYPELKLIYAIPNGQIGGNARLGKWMKEEGKRAGVPDLCLPVARFGIANDCGEIKAENWYALYIEMKKRGKKLEPSQKEFIPLLQEAGNKVVVCYSADEAWREIEEYLKL